MPVPLVSANLLEDLIGDNHRLQALMTVDMGDCSRGHALNKFSQFLRQGVGARGIDGKILDIDEVAENVLFQRFQVHTGLSGSFQGRVPWSRASPGEKRFTSR